MLGFDVDAYFERIGHSGRAPATLETLAAIHYRHAVAIPFENLNPLLRWPVRLDAQSLFQKLVCDRRGGWCFEQNLLLSHCLTAIGFQITWLAARVTMNNPEGAITPRSHMLLLIDLEDRRYVADVGFGGLTLTAPLRLEPDVEQTTPHERFRMIQSGGVFTMQAQIAGTWKSLYRFDLQEQVLPDYEVSNWYLSNHPNSHFVTGLIAARPDRDRRYALRNCELAIHHTSGESERRVLTGADDLRATLADVFRIALPDAPELLTALQRVASQAAQVSV
jgi:N-hydroxyarylamine O-acetyltransferase